MALIKWGQEDDNKKEDDLFGTPTIKTISSVQSSWQPTQADTATSTDGSQNPQPQNDNYLLSDQKAQIDAQKQQRDAAEQAAQAETARQTAIARQEASARAVAAEAVAAQKPVGESAHRSGASAGDFVQGVGEGLWKGAASAVGSGASFVSSLLTGKAENDVTKATRDWQQTADKWGNSVEANDIGEFIGNLPGGIVSGIVDPANYMVRGVRNAPEMLAANIAAGSSDTQTRKIGIEEQKRLQVNLFGEDVAKNGDGAMLMEGIAKPGEMILNVATGGLSSLALAPAKQGLNLLAKEVAKEATKQGSINLLAGVPLSVLEQAARDLEITPESVGKDAFVQAVLGAVIGGSSRYRSMKKGEVTPVGADEAALTPVVDGATKPPTADVPPASDGNVSFQTQLDNSPLGQSSNLLRNSELTPTHSDGIPTTPVPEQAQAPAPVEPTMPQNVTPVVDTPVSPGQVAPVADGVVKPAEVVPAVDPNMPVVKSEQVRALQDSRAGTSQADEAVINQRLKELNAHRVDVEGGSPNQESLDRWGSERGTGGHGTGLYFNQAEQPLYTSRGADHKPVRTAFTNTMEKPFTIKNADQATALNKFSQYLMASAHSGELRPELADFARQAGIPFDEQVLAQLVRKKQAELAGRQAGLSDKSLADVDQPINDYMKAQGYDGVLNNGDDTARGGSVIFRGTPAYDKAMGAYNSSRADAPVDPTVGISQKLQQIDTQTPKVADTKLQPFKTESSIYEANQAFANKETVYDHNTGKQEPIADYYRTKKGKDYAVVNMTPDEYLQRAFKNSGSPDYGTWLSIASKERVTEYANAMKKGDKFSMAYIDEHGAGQEGRHRALAAKEAGVTEMPVTVVSKHDPSKPKAVTPAPVDPTVGISPKTELPTPKAPVDPIAQKAGITPADSYDASLTKLDDALDNGKITNDEHAQMEDQLFNDANKRGEAMAEDSTPDGMGDVTPVKDGDIPKAPSEKDLRKTLANRVMKSTSGTSDMQGKLARAVGLAQDTKTDVRTLLQDANVDSKTSNRIADLFDRAEKIGKVNADTQKGFRKAFVKGGVGAIDDTTARTRNRNTRDEQALKSQINSEINKLSIKGSMKERLTQGFENIVAGRSANMLNSASVIEKNVAADLLATLGYTVKNPVQMARSMTKHGNIAVNTLKSQTHGWKDTPKSVTEAFKYVTGNAFQTAMAGAQAAANLRSGAVRTQISKWVHKELVGKELSSVDAEKLSRTFGNDIEALVNMATGVENGTINDLSYRRALKNFKQAVKTGNEADYSKYLDSIDRQGSLAASIMKGIESEKLGRVAGGVVNALLPFMRNAVNMTTKAFTRDLNPLAKSLLDEIRADQMGVGQKLWSIVKNKTVDYGVLAALSTVLVYDDGSDAEKPRGVSIDLGDGKYFSVRGTPIELPLALTLMTRQIVEDTASGSQKSPDYYLGIIKNSIPYISQMEQNSGVVNSLMDLSNEEGDNGYAAKSFGVNLAKSLTPFSSNSIQPYVAGKQGKSLDARSSYDKDPVQWYKNAVGQSFSPAFRDTLPLSRDTAGRVRTVDNQGAFINKTINDANTKQYNSTISNLIDYGRKNKLGKGVEDMFNTYDTGKNNNFKSVQDSITFLDAVDGKPDNAKKLESNPKLTDLAAQIRDGFYGDTGSQLLTLDGQELKSDASVPNANGTKNSKLPLSMQSIKNAVAATDLPKEQQDRMYAISQANAALYTQVESKAMTYAQYKVIAAESEKEYVSILSGSESYKKLTGLMNNLDKEGFFNVGGIGSTRSGQTYLWNSLNALLGSKGATPAANYPKDSRGYTPAGSGFGATNKPGDRKNTGIKWSPVKARQMAATKTGKYTPVDIKVKLGNAVKKDKTQNYADRTI